MQSDTSAASDLRALRVRKAGLHGLEDEPCFRSLSICVLRIQLFEIRLSLTHHPGSAQPVYLGRKWTETKNSRPGRKCVVNLEDPIWFDSNGEKVLQQILTESALVIVSRSYMNHVVESLKDR
jgi:hypothetical protein